MTLKTKKNISKQIDSDSNAEQADVFLQRIIPFAPESSVFTVVCPREQYSAGRIVHAIEDCNANVLNLNLTADNIGEGLVAVYVRVDRKNISAITRSLARYGFSVLGGEDVDEEGEREDDRRRINELLRYIDI